MRRTLKTLRPSTTLAPIGHGEHEDGLVGRKERIKEQRHKLRCAESVREGVRAKHRRKQQTLRDPLALQELVPDLRASQETKRGTQALLQR